MKHQEKLIKFIQLKNEIIEKETDLFYINQDDIDGLKRWPETLCIDVYQELIENIQFGKASGINDGTCIWCIENRNCNCYECEYGARHGICNHIGSLFDSYSTDTRETLLDNETYQHIIKKIEDTK